MVIRNLEQERVNRMVAEAVERGVNYFDVAPTYGNAEQLLGPALEPYRKHVFLAEKTRQRSKEGTEQEFNQTLKRLKTNYLDLYQLHAIYDVDRDVKAAFAEDGAMEFIREAKKGGRIRHVGFSAHSTAAALAALDLYDFDSLLFPVNFAAFYKEEFGPEVLEKAKEKGASVMALKSMVRQKWPKDAPDRKKWSPLWYQPTAEEDQADLALRWSLDQPMVVSALPPGDPRLHEMALDLAMRTRPVSIEEERTLRDLAGQMTPLFPRG
jgi:predicted aldo/keto reductase-like oxidoreductase